MFHYFTIKFHLSFLFLFAFFAFFRFKFYASIRFSNFCFEAKQSEAKFKYIFLLFSLFSLFFAFFRFFSLFFTFFRLIFVSLRFFHLIFAYSTFVFASDFWCFASKWIMWNQAFFRFQAKRNFRFNFKFRFWSESEGAPYLLPLNNFPFQKFILNNYLLMNKITYLLSNVKFSANSSKHKGLYN